MSFSPLSLFHSFTLSVPYIPLDRLSSSHIHLFPPIFPSSLSNMSELVTPQSQSLRQLLVMSFSALGIIYSDMGTSPLYVLNGIWHASGDVPSAEDVIGGVSAIVWTLTLLPLVKYCLIALYFGTDQGEGGVFALFIGLFPRKVTSSDEQRELTKTSTRGFDRRDFEGKTGSEILKKSKWPLMIWAFFGTALVLADGILTPAVSVVSAVGGIAVAKPSTINSVTPIAIGFLIFVFIIQSFGTHKISIVYSPLVVIWLALLGITGIINIVAHPGIFRAFDPSRAIMFFVRTGDYDALAGVLLCITGCEGMFANLGQFNAPSIRIGFVYAYICLVLAYLGQGAKIITDGPNVIPNIFYNSIPGGTGSGVFWLLWIFGLFATLIASQTLITASFSLTQQLISMEALPRLRMKYTSEAFKGQIYFASVNYILMIAVVGAVAGFGTDASLTNAYGFAVSTVMFVTTTLIALQIPFVKNKSWLLAIPFLIFFGFIEGLFWGASLRKVPHGAWFPLSVGVALTILMTFYSWGRSLEKSFDKSHTSRLHDIIFRRHRVASSHEGRAHARFEITQIPACDDEKDQQTNPVELREEIVELPREKRPGNPSVSIEKKALKTPTEDKVELGEQLFLNVRETYLELPRVPTCAIFHKTSNTSKGIPHTFYQFLKGWPALPRVVIFASTEVTNAPHVALEDRYIITKVRSFEGIYGLTVRTGYRDQSRTNMADVVPYLIQAERQFDPKISLEKIKEIEQAAANTTQIMPSYVLLSQKTRWASWGYIRKMLVEELYARLRVMFPDQEIQTDKGDGEAIHIGVTAHI